jgi:hypothetical protein
MVIAKFVGKEREEKKDKLVSKMAAAGPSSWQ